MYQWCYHSTDFRTRVEHRRTIYEIQRSRFLTLRPRENFFFAKQYVKSLHQLLYLLELPHRIPCCSYRGFRDLFTVLGHSSFAPIQHRKASQIDLDASFDRMEQDSLMNVYHDLHILVSYAIREEEIAAERLQRLSAIAAKLRKLSAVVVTADEAHSARYLGMILVIMDRLSSFPTGQATSTLLHSEGSQRGHDTTFDDMMSKGSAEICADQSTLAADIASSTRGLHDILAAMEQLSSIFPGQATPTATA